METKQKTTQGFNKLTNLLFFLSILFFTIGLNFQDTPPPNGWYQQWLPDINNRPISDVTFLDSLTGFAVTPYTANDTAYILKTTNGGDNWIIVFKGPTNIIGGFNAVQFLNLNTGYVCGNFLRKTTNGGLNWFQVNTSGIFPENMYVLNEDTIWLIDSESLTGGVFRTTNGGVSWVRQLSAGNQNPDKIYMYNARIGFICRASISAYLRKTTDGGFNWFNIPNEWFTDMYFIDSLKGWKCGYELDSIKKTTDGGITWQKLLLPPTGGFFNLSAIKKFTFINKDTIFGVGARAYTSLGFRGLIYKSTNSGQSWGYQLPDTNTITIGRYYHTKFVNKNIGWAYSTSSGVHTVTGGDTTFYVSVQQVSQEIPKDYKLHQNYPNPFNNETIINYELRIKGNIELSLYDISGKLIKVLIKERQGSGSYEYRFNGAGLTSGVYFYSLTINGKLIDTKKAVLLK